MSKAIVLWELPKPPSAVIRGPTFEVLPRRQCQITLSTEADSGSEVLISLAFKGVEAFRCTYLGSLGSVDSTLRRVSYGAVVEIDGDPWFKKIKESFEDYHRAAGMAVKGVKHLMITFDDGPCFEVICEGFSATPSERDGAFG